MPIPTKKPAVRPRTEEASTIARVASSKRTRSITEQTRSQNDTDKGSETTAASETVSANAISSRLPARPASGSKQVPGTIKPARPLSVNVSTSRSTSESSKTSSRLAPTSSTASRSIANTQSRMVAHSTKPNPESNTSRIRSTSTTSTAKVSANTISKHKPASAIPAPARSVRSLKETTSTSSSHAKPSNTKFELPSAPSRFDDELFQLKLLHSNSHHTLHQYKQSIHTSLSQKHLQLQNLETQVLDLEAETTQALSVNALSAWLDRTHSRAAQSQIQQLSSAIKDLDALTADPSALAPLQTFDDWLTDTLAVREDRMSHSPSSEDMVFIHPLGHAWTQSMHTLQQNLTVILTTLRDLSVQDQNKDRDVETRSGVDVLIARHRRFAATLLQEVETAVVIEREIMRGERAWEKRELERAMGELTARDSMEGTYAGIWAS